MKDSHVAKEAAAAALHIDKIINTGKVRTNGGRNDTAQSDDGCLDVTLNPSGIPGKGTNPEQLFAAGWAANFMAAINVYALKQEIVIPRHVSVDAEVALAGLNKNTHLQARLYVNLPGLSFEDANAIVIGANELCPYSKITQNNIDMEINVVI
ncbi:Ohr family peroxiredoxin [Mucilaginibacter sp. BJC16-A38]|uniref:Ohr family peroxiredoxin n=1 Tax=Mucilaginibacter phenanthrenivorans TaxID=1234842 RepID=UPI0021577C47|nr:Ohr family peroxiredoxin [Mucilaginibacter phenanthrenivorans]MCR8557302.1 Ohr family peroxiredoxin [Mucilaginibacter phenanthrenivorans]